MADPTVLLVHKVPAFWESEAKAKTGIGHDAEFDFSEIKNPTDEEKFFLDELESDIFFLIADSIAKHLSLPRVDVLLGHDPREIRNWDVISKDGYLDRKGNFVFWSTSSPDRLPELDEVSVLILRGNYPNYHNHLIRRYNPSISIVYPATSLFFPHFISRFRKIIPRTLKGFVQKDEISRYIENISSQPVFSKVKPPDTSEFNNELEISELRGLFRNYLESCIGIAQKVRERKSPGKYSVVLYDEVKNLDSMRRVYPDSTLLKLNKSFSPQFKLNPNSNRTIDVIFTGTTIQKTKNHDLFYKIVDRILSQSPDCRIVIVGATDDSDKIRKRWDGFNVEIYGRIPKVELCDLFNRSRFHLITSGRDCFPRTIPESIICGCHVLALDILSDGLTVISENPLIGTVIGTGHDTPMLTSGYSISIKPVSNSIADQIISEIDISRNHLLISLAGSEIFSNKGMIQLDKIWEEVDLSLS